MQNDNYVSDHFPTWNYNGQMNDDIRRLPRARKRQKNNENNKVHRIFYCPTIGCNRSFYWKGSLTWHLKNSCDNIAPAKYKCPYCRYSCKIKNDIRKHVTRIHKNEEVYVIELSQ